MAVEVALLPPGSPAARAVARCTLVVGLLTVAFAAYSLHSPPCFLHCYRIAGMDAAAALPRWLLWSGACQAAAGVLSLLLPGHARRGLALIALAAGAASIALFTMVLAAAAFTVYRLLSAALIGKGALGAGLVFSTVVVGCFVAVLLGQE